MVDARLPDGCRVNAIIPPLALAGPSLTIRKFARDALTLDDLIELGTLTPAGAPSSSAACVRGKLNILISGGTGTGKTTLLNALSAFIPDDERIVTIEDAAELAAPAAPRRLARDAPAEHRGRGRGHASATWCATRCACGPTASSSARSAAPRRSTCSRP